MDTITLPRTGLAPLRFQGELVAESEGRIQSGREHNRYHDLYLYRTPGGGFVVAQQYRTMWQGELPKDRAVACRGASGVQEVLTGYDPAVHVHGFPPGDHYAEKQRRLLADVKGRYEAQVSELLEKLPVDLVDQWSLMTDPRDRALIGGTPETDAYGLAVAAELCRRFTPADLSRADWNYLADVLNPGPTPGMDQQRWTPEYLIASVEDADRIDGTGRKWYGDEAEELAASVSLLTEQKPLALHPRVKELVAKLRAVGWLGAQAILIAVGFFCSHAGDVDHLEHPWWTIEWREANGAKS